MIHTEEAEVSFDVLDFRTPDKDERIEYKAFILKQMLHRMIERLPLSDLPKDFTFTIVDPRKEDINKVDTKRMIYLTDLINRQMVEFKIEYKQK